MKRINNIRDITKNNINEFYQEDGTLNPERLRGGVIPSQYQWCKTKIECVNAIKNNLSSPPKCWCGNDLSFGRTTKEGYKPFCSDGCTKLLTKEGALKLLDKNGRFSGNRATVIMTIHPSYSWCKDWSEYIWCILNDITSPPKCKNTKCNKPTKKYGWSSHRPYCNTSCSHDPDNTENRDEGIKARRTLMEDSGKWIKDEDREDYDMYSTIIRRESEKSAKNKFDITELEKRGQYKDSLHLDHRYSIYDGFYNNIPTIWMYQSVNLELIPRNNNLSKGTKSSIKIDDLF